jgi:undecaprenyl diphosphate synthase
LPAHIAVIMDGNGRWARERGLPRTEGHRRGAESVRTTVTACARKGVQALTLYAFSTENWKRPAREVTFLMRMLRRFARQERKLLLENNIRLRLIGHPDDLPPGLREELAQIQQASSSNTGMVLCVALSYGGRREIVDAARRFAGDVLAGRESVEELTEERFAQYLDTAGLPDPDLLIRTAGEMRLSNFLLWQLSYAELYVTPTCWPDFREKELEDALAAYAGRQRKFGAIEPTRR